MSNDDDRTRVIGPQGIAAAFGAAAPESPMNELTSSVSNNVLPHHTRLGEFEIIGLIGEGGFGIVYLALDHSLERRVAIKEYMPSSLAIRGNGVQVSVKSPRHAETFNAGLRSFVNEAKLLAYFDHPSLVKVHRFWEANGTAYMVMPYYEGVTLKQALRELQGSPSEQWLKSLLGPLIDALELMHTRQCYHRDIAPDNLLILNDGRPVLLDFGAARRVIGDMTQALTVILKPGFAPVEQYAEGPEMNQGPWTDVYALAALIYYALSGKAPTPSVARMMNDTLVPATKVGLGRYSPEFLQAIDAALVLQPERRTPTMALFRDHLGIAAVERFQTLLDSRTIDGSRPIVAESVSWKNETTPTHPASDTLSPAQRAGLDTVTSGPNDAELSAHAETPRPPPAPLGSRAPRPDPTPSTQAWMLLPAVLAVVGLAAGVGWYLHQSGTGTEPAPTKPGIGSSKSFEPGASSSAAPPGSPNTQSPTSAGLPATNGIVAATATEASASPASSPPVPATKPAFSPALVNDLLFQARAADWAVTVDVNPKRVEIDKDYLKFTVRSERAGYLYIFMFGSDSRDWWLVFPNGKDGNNRLEPGVDLQLPRKSWPLQAGGPPGITRFLALASPTERDFRGGGLKLTRDFGKFDLNAAASAYQIAENPVALFAGAAPCDRTQPNCDTGFGAAQFEIEEFSRKPSSKKP